LADSEHDPVSVAAADLAALRARARAIVGNRFITTAARVAMLRDNEAAIRTALTRWRTLSGILNAPPAVPNNKAGGRYW
jgi:hypothetical protein